MGGSFEIDPHDYVVIFECALNSTPELELLIFILVA
mgnify:CR=1 FL=1